MTPAGTLLLTRQEIAALLDLDECIAVVEQAFQLHVEGKTLPPGVLGIPSQGGGFHIKAPTARKASGTLLTLPLGAAAGHSELGLVLKYGLIIVSNVACRTARRGLSLTPFSTART